MNIPKLFEDFWQKKMQYKDIPNKERQHQTWSEAFSDFTEFYQIDEYVEHLSQGKASTRRIMLGFLEYLNEVGEGPVPSDLPNKIYYDSTLERRLEIAKYLHERRTLDEIEDAFGIRYDTLNGDLRALEDGIEFLGSTISIEKENDGQSVRYYSHTMHPIFLPLNLTEIHALTVYLKSLKMHEGERIIIDSIVERIKAQLSDYAFEALFPNEKRKDVNLSNIDDEALARDRETAIGFLMKSGEKCQFLWNGNKYTGRIRYRDGEHYAELKNGERLDADIDELEIIPESIHYR